MWRFGLPPAGECRSALRRSRDLLPPEPRTHGQPLARVGGEGGIRSRWRAGGLLRLARARSDDAVPESDRGLKEGPAGSDHMRKARPGHGAQHPAGIGRELLGQLGALLPVEGTSRFEIIGAVQDPPDHVPLGEPEGMIAHGIEHAAVRLAFGPRMCGAGGAVLQRGWPRTVGSPLCQLLRSGIAQGIVEPDGTEPAVPFRVRYADGLGPARGQLRDALNVPQAFRCDDGPLGQGGPESRRGGARRPDGNRELQLSARSGGRTMRF